MVTVLICAAVLAVLAGLGYLAASAGAARLHAQAWGSPAWMCGQEIVP